MTQGRDLTSAQTGAVVVALGFAVGLVGDACHVSSGTTTYEWDGGLTIWRSAFWFPLLVGGVVLGAAVAGERWAGAPVRRRGRADLVTGVALVLALYALTAVVRDQPDTVSVALTGALAVAIWSWWDPSLGAFALGLCAAILGPVGEILIVEADWAHYNHPADSLSGVGPWLPCLYFAAGAVASRVWRIVSRDGR